MPPRDPQSSGKLTQREMETMMWTAQGKTCFEISVMLGVSEETIRVHVKNSCRKLRASNKTHAVALALQTGVISLGQPFNGFASLQ